MVLWLRLCNSFICYRRGISVAQYRIICLVLMHLNVNWITMIIIMQSVENMYSFQWYSPDFPFCYWNIIDDVLAFIYHPSYMCTYTNTFHYLSKSDDLNWLKGRDLALSYDKTPHINKKSKIQSLGTKSHKKLRLHNGCGTTYYGKVLWFHRFTGSQLSNYAKDVPSKGHKFKKWKHSSLSRPRANSQAKRRGHKNTDIYSIVFKQRKDTFISYTVV